MKPLLVITSTVYVNSLLTLLTDPQIRLEQYIESVLFYIKSGEFSEIVICDNSGFNYDSIDRIKIEAIRRNIRIEPLSFSGDKDRIKSQGKGYGEGEILAHIFKYSQLMEGASSFVKITGRVKVLNIKSVLKSTMQGKNYFLKIGLNPFRNRKMVDTRFYYCLKEDFTNNLIESYNMVNDFTGYYLERSYYDKLQTSMKYNGFLILPRFIGVSGSHGGNLAEKNHIFMFKYFLNFVYRILQRK